MSNMKKREAPGGPCKLEMEVDKLSNLPGHVIDKVLSHLSLREAVRTSVLSSKWRYKWVTLPHLVFDNQSVLVSSQDQSVIRNKLVNIVDHVLLLHTGPIHKFKLSHRDLQGVSDIDRWILFLSRSSIKEFILEIWKGHRYKLPSSIYLCQKLIHLELFNCLLKPPITFNGFKSLKSLDLQHITMEQIAFELLIYNCPILERLTLMNFEGFAHLKIHAPNLLFFDVGGVFEDVTFKDTIHLAVVSIGLYVNSGYDRTLPLGNPSNLIKFFSHLPCIQRLEVQSFFLKARPEEQTAVRSITSIKEEDYQSCSFNQLRLVKIVGISGLRHELNFINFLLENSPVLEKMTVKPAVTDRGWEMQKELLKELLCLRRASVNAQIIYLDP